MCEASLSKPPDLARSFVRKLRTVAAAQILGARHGLKVGRVHAWRLSTQVIQIHALWRNADETQIGLTMSKAARTQAALPENAVTVAIMCPIPDPTLGHVTPIFCVPKRLAPLDPCEHAARMTRAKSHRLALDPAFVFPVSLRKRHALAATALAEARRDIVSHAASFGEVVIRGRERRSSRPLHLIVEA